MERRTYAHGEIRAEPAGEDRKPRFAGYAAVFNELSEDLGGFREKILPGAFADAIAGDDVRALFNHDANYVLGRNRAGTLTLREDDHGLAFEIEAPDTQWARDLHVSVERGDVSQCSFGFRVMDDTWYTEDGEDRRDLKKVRLFDISIVTYPAYTGTEASARSLDAPEERKKERAPLSLYKRKLDLIERSRTDVQQ
jgi:hypothetical protein